MTGTIQDYDEELLTVTAPYSDTMRLIRQRITRAEICLDDGRTISADQRRKIYATLRDISLWSGHAPEYLKELMKYGYIGQTGREYFSLSDCDMTTAREYLSFLIDFCLEWDIPCADSLLERSPDIGAYVYSCLVHRRCAVCGGKAELHHVDRVGLGRDRREITHIGMRALPLCRVHHGEAHSLGEESFEGKYHLFGIKLDPDLAKVWKLKGA